MNTEEGVQVIQMDARLAAIEAGHKDPSTDAASPDSAEDRLAKAAKIRRFIEKCQEDEDAEEAKGMNEGRRSEEGLLERLPFCFYLFPSPFLSFCLSLSLPLPLSPPHPLPPS